EFCSSCKTNLLNALVFNMLLPKITDKTIAPTIEIITNINDLNNKFGSVNEKSKTSFGTILKAKLQMINAIPAIPAIPKPGMTNISKANNITPIINNNISQLAANPSIYNGVK